MANRISTFSDGSIKIANNLYRAMFGWERPDINWLGRPYGTFDNIPLLENPKLEKGSGIDITQHWNRIKEWNPDGGGYTQQEKLGWLVSREGETTMPISYDEITGIYRQHTPEVAGGAIVNVIEIQGNFAKVQTRDVSESLPPVLPEYLIYTWSALYPPSDGFPTGRTWLPKGGIKFPVLYWRKYAYLPLPWLVKL